MSKLQNRRILVVEDEALLGMMAEDTLSEAGAIVVGPAASVETAMVLLEGMQLDAAIVDLNLAGVMALPVANALTARGVPYLITTGYSEGTAPEAEQASAGMVVKPYDPAEMVAKLAALWS